MKKPKNRLLRVLRGGSWDLVSADYFRAADRLSPQASLRYYGDGFRCAASTQESLPQMMRGGSWYNNCDRAFYAENRISIQASYRRGGLCGFRCAVSDEKSHENNSK